MNVDFSTAAYRMAHGKDPKGYGTWAFDYRTAGSARKAENPEPLWAPAGTYAEAKKWVKAQMRAKAPEGWVGTVFVTVCT